MFGTGALRLLQGCSIRDSSTGVFALAGTPVQFQERHMRSWGEPSKRYVPVASNALLITHGGPSEDQVILCDSGAGEHVPPNLKVEGASEVSLQSSLGAIGLSFEEVNTYILGHGHWDHSGGVFTQEGGFLLPNATIVVSRGSLEEIRQSAGKRSFVPGLAAELERLETEGRLIVVDVDSSSLSKGGVTCPQLGNGIVLYASGGHAEQLHPAVIVGGATLVHMGDLIPTSAHAVSPTRFMLQFDPLEGRERLMKEKEAALNRFSRDGAFLLYYHDPRVVASRIRVRESKSMKMRCVDPLHWPA